MKRLLKIEFVRFCIVGGSGFLINLVLLTLLYKILGLPVFLAQLISGEVSLSSNFVLHHTWTYKQRNSDKSIKRLLLQFHATSWIAILGGAGLVYGGTHALHMEYIVALIITSLISLLWSFTWTRFVIWKKVNKKEDGINT